VIQKIAPTAFDPPFRDAVLPPANLSSDPNQKYLSDGMTDALITDLAQVGSLKVISRTSTMQYKQTKKTLPEIAREPKNQGAAGMNLIELNRALRKLLKQNIFLRITPPL
jgi:curli biogenesis system outer membrane secretion channel CsgG